MPAAGLEIAQRKAVKMAKEEIERRKKNPSEEVQYFLLFLMEQYFILPSNDFITFYLSSLKSEQYDRLNPEKKSVEELTALIEKNDESVPLCDLYAMRGEAFKNEHKYAEVLTLSYHNDSISPLKIIRRLTSWTTRKNLATCAQSWLRIINYVVIMRMLTSSICFIKNTLVKILITCANLVAITMKWARLMMYMTSH